MINAAKNKTMLFNFTRDYQFTTRLNLEGKSVEVIKHSKLLGTIIQDDLKWDLNTANIVKKANMRLELLRRVASLRASTEDLKKIYILYLRSVLEHSSVVWHSSQDWFSNEIRMNQEVFFPTMVSFFLDMSFDW